MKKTTKNQYKKNPKKNNKQPKITNNKNKIQSAKKMMDSWNYLHVSLISIW